MVTYWVLLAVIGCERVAELAVSQRHAAASLRRGGVESGQGHFPVMVALHAALLAGCVAEPLALHRTFVPALGWPMIAVVVAANILRWWCVFTLGERWTARVIVIPGMPLVRSGPYQWFAHPNYVAVIVEGAALPLAGGAWITACAFTLLNAGLLTVRIRCESRALGVLTRPTSPDRHPAAGGGMGAGGAGMSGDAGTDGGGSGSAMVAGSP